VNDFPLGAFLAVKPLKARSRFSETEATQVLRLKKGIAI